MLYVQAHIPTAGNCRLIWVISLHLLRSKAISQFDRADVIFFYNASCGVQEQLSGWIISSLLLLIISTTDTITS